MTRLRRARLAGELVALGISYFHCCDTVDLVGLAVCVVRSGISPAREGRKSSGQILGSCCFNLLSQTEGKIQLHPAHIAVFNHDLFAKLPLALGAFALEQVAPTGLRTNDLARGSDLKPFCHGPLGFAACDCFWHGGWKISERGPVGNNKINDHRQSHELLALTVTSTALPVLIRCRSYNLFFRSSSS